MTGPPYSTGDGAAAKGNGRAAGLGGAAALPYKGAMVPSPALPATRQARAALAVLLCGAVALSFSGIFAKLSELDPSATAFHRMFLALPVFWLWCELEGRGRIPVARPTARRDYWLLAIAGLCFAGDLAVWHWSLRLTTVANATLLASSAPIFVVLGGWLLFRERVTATFLAGMVVAMAGAAVLVGGSVSLSPRHLVGDLLGVVTGAFYGAYILAVARLRVRFSTATIMAFSGVACCAALFIVAVASGESLVAATARGWAILIALALVSQVGGQSLIAWALAHLPAAFSSVSLLVNPVAAALFAWVILGEAVGPWQAAGGGAVLAGIVLARRGTPRRLAVAEAPP